MSSIRVAPATRTALRASARASLRTSTGSHLHRASTTRPRRGRQRRAARDRGRANTLPPELTFARSVETPIRLPSWLFSRFRRALIWNFSVDDVTQRCEGPGAVAHAGRWARHWRQSHRRTPDRTRGRIARQLQEHARQGVVESGRPSNFARSAMRMTGVEMSPLQ